MPKPDPEAPRFKGRDASGAPLGVGFDNKVTRERRYEE